jgi:hypothetical protein
MSRVPLATWTTTIDIVWHGMTGSVNFLSSSVWKQSEIPSCIAGLPAYSILRDVREYNQSGKQTEAQPFDLSVCVSYQICGKGGVFSYPHVDHYSLLNTAFVDNGEKLWPLWGRLSNAEFAVGHQQWHHAGTGPICHVPSRRRFVRPTCWNSPRSVFGHGRPHDGHNALGLEAASAGAAAIDLQVKIS